MLTLNNCSASGTVKYYNLALDPLVGFTVSVNNLTAILKKNTRKDFPNSLKQLQLFSFSAT
jgi:hypothetical protein